MNILDSQPRLSVVLPVFNEVRVLLTLVEKLVEAVADEAVCLELIFVNDGSTDGSGQRLDELADQHDFVRILHLARNFGHQAAVQAGLMAASGHAVVIMDADLQDDPRAISVFLAAWRDGAEVVYGVRVDRKEAWWKRQLFSGFYRLLNAVADRPMPTDAGNFCLLDRQVVDQIIAMPERDRYFPGLRQWVGFRQTGVRIERLARYDGRPRVSLRGLFCLAQTALFSFSRLPLRVFYGIAMVSFLVFVGVGTFSIYHSLIKGFLLPGWASQLLVAAFFGGINSLGVAILGEYLIRIYDQVRGRPAFIVQRRVNLGREFRPENVPQETQRESSEVWSP